MPPRKSGTHGGSTVVSPGKSTGSSFDQALNGQPFFLTGSWDVVEGAGDARDASAYLPKGANAEERKQAETILALAAAARTFYAGILGPAPDTPIRIVAVTRGGGDRRRHVLTEPPSAVEAIRRRALGGRSLARYGSAVRHGSREAVGSYRRLTRIWRWRF